MTEYILIISISFILDYLLCHDDCVQDRVVAFVYYLNYDWLKEWGGTLDVFSVDENFNAEKNVHSINPEFNTMIFFPVGRQTYHQVKGYLHDFISVISSSNRSIGLQVAENVSNFSRISINGWFHCNDKVWPFHKQKIELPSPIFLPITLSTTKVKSV